MDDAVSAEELKKWRLWQPLCRARFFADASAVVELTLAEQEGAWRAFCERHRIHPDSGETANPDFHGIDLRAIRELAHLERRVAKWKQLEFAARVPEMFEREKASFETLVYSLLRVESPGLARELWFRISDGETTFAEAAKLYGQTPERYTGGIVGPVPWQGVHPAIAEPLRTCAEGALLPPIRLGEAVALVRMEKLIAPVLDSRVEQVLIERLAQRYMEDLTR